MSRRIAPAAAAAALVWSCGLAVVTPVHAGVMDFLFGKSASRSDSGKPSPNRREWTIGEFTAVRLHALEQGGAPNEHPATVSPKALSHLLASIETPVKGRYERLLDDAEVAALAEPVSQALSLAGPNDDVLLLSTSRRDAGLLGTPYGVTARLFVQGGQLQFIVNDARLDFVNAYRGSRIAPEFKFGSRAQRSSATVTTSAGAQTRPDWVALRLDGHSASAPAAAPAQVAAPAPSTAPAPVAPAPTAARAQAPAPAPAAAPAGGRDARFFEEQEHRLRTLKRLREQNLISEEEYQQKRREVLQAL